MDLRKLPTGLNAEQRCNERLMRIEKELDLDLSILRVNDKALGSADEKNCEQMFGHVPIPVGLAGPLSVSFSNKKKADVYLPLATTEGALVASVNRGCKAVSEAGGATTQSIYHGMTRSLAFQLTDDFVTPITEIKQHEKNWKKIGEETSGHLKILKYDLDMKDGYLFLNIACDTDEAMGMNMTTIAAQKIGKWLEAMVEGMHFLTVAGNVDSDKKPSRRTHSQGRGYEVHASVILNDDVIASVLKSSAKMMADVAKAKLEIGSDIAGALSKNLHAANIVAALYLATGQDAAHVVEGSLTDTTVEQVKKGLTVSVRAPAILIGARGGGTSLPAQSKALKILMKPKTRLHPCKQLAESIGAAILAGEISLLAAQASHQLAKAHKELGRS